MKSTPLELECSYFLFHSIWNKHMFLRTWDCFLGCKPCVSGNSLLSSSLLKRVDSDTHLPLRLWYWWPIDANIGEMESLD